MKRYIRSASEYAPGWSKRYDKELQETYYVLAIPRRTATVTEFDNDGDWGYTAQVRCKDIDSKKDKTFYGPDSLDKAMDWAEKELYKTSVTSAIKYNNEGDLVSVDGWDVRTGLIKRIDHYLSANPKVTAPVGYVDPHSRDYESLKAMYGDYVVTPFKNIKNADLIAYADDHGLLDDK